MGCAGLFAVAVALFSFPAMAADAPDHEAMARQLTDGLQDAFNTHKHMKFTLFCDEPMMVNGRSCMQRVISVMRVENIVSSQSIDPGAPCLDRSDGAKPNRCIQVTYQGGATARFATTVDGQVFDIDMRMPSP